MIHVLASGHSPLNASKLATCIDSCEFLYTFVLTGLNFCLYIMCTPFFSHFNVIELLWIAKHHQLRLSCELFQGHQQMYCRHDLCITNVIRNAERRNSLGTCHLALTNPQCHLLTLDLIPWGRGKHKESLPNILTWIQKNLELLIIHQF